MKLDLKNVKVEYTVKEVILVCSLLFGGAVHIARTEIEFSKVQKMLGQCEQRVTELEKTTRAEMDYLRCGNAGPPCVQQERKK